MRNTFALILCHCLALHLCALTFDVEFTEGGSSVGSGYFSVNPDPGNATVPYNPATMDFSFDLGTYGLFDESHIQTAGEISIFATAGGRHLVFDGSSGTAFGGSFELNNGSYWLSFAPSGISLFLVADPSFQVVVQGEYAARAIPDAGATGLLLALSIPLLSFVRRRC